MRKNVGTIDAIIRITLGLVGLAYGIGRMSRRPYRTPWLLMTLSAMQVAEGFTRFCPMLYALGINTRSQKGVESVWGRMVAAGGKMANAMDTMTNKIRPAFAKQAPKQQPSPADQALEGESREHAAAKEPQPSDQYSRDEHLYPTYS
jgi:hypothetical protein